MTHNHGNEYQIRMVREDGLEELSGWMNSIEEVAQAIIEVPDPKGKAYWLLVRNTICPNCSEREQISEYPFAPITSPRCIPHNSRYLQVVESRNRYILGVSASRHSP
jgi:hypothetical protein